MSVPDSIDSAKLNRRALLPARYFWWAARAALTRFARHRGGVGGGVGPVFSPEQFALLEQVSDVIIPATDTPGALDAGRAGVHAPTC